MKALIRDKGETIVEDHTLEFVNWNTGAPLTDSGWFGGPYTLVDNYVEVADGAIYDVGVYPEEEEPEEVTVTEDTVIINGKEYTKAELRALLGE